MSKQRKSKWYGKSAASEVVTALRSGAIESLVMATGDTATLSQMSRELVRSLRDIGARVEFYQKSDAEAAIHAANKLLADVPVDQLTSAKSDEPPRLLLIDGAEQLEESELTALQRLSRALRGSSYRAVYFLKADGESGLAEPLQQLLLGSPTWWVDESAPIDTRVVEPEPTVQELPKRVEESLSEAPSPETALSDREDILTALAAERARGAARPPPRNARVPSASRRRAGISLRGTIFVSRLGKPGRSRVRSTGVAAGLSGKPRRVPRDDPQSVYGCRRGSLPRGHAGFARRRPHSLPRVPA